MAILVDEYRLSRPTVESESPSITLIYKIITTGDDVGSGTEDIDVKYQVAVTTPAVYDGLVIQSLSIDPVTTGVWTGTVVYGLRKKPEIGDTTVRISTTGGTHHITHSFDTVSSHAAPGEQAPAVQGIGDQGKGQLQGVDIQIPAFSYNVTTLLDPSFVTTAYINKLFTLTAQVNNYRFKIFDRGEALFMGGILVQKSTQPWIEASFDFIGSVNAHNLRIGDITGIVKKGHEYLWARYRTADDSVAKTLIEKPIAAYVEQVYEYGNFWYLRIGI